MAVSVVEKQAGERYQIGQLPHRLCVAIVRRPELQRSDVRVSFFRTAQHSESYAYYTANTMTWL